MMLRQAETWFAAVARRKALCALGAAVLALGLRALLLPIWPIPAPMIHDEFAYLLQADTFANGRLANPPHPLWQFFETIYVIQQPSYASKYPPGQGLILAAGQVLFGDPWWGVWISCGLLAIATSLALQAWLPPRWALLGIILNVQLCFYSYWMNSYWGGALTATGGALVLASFRRLARPGFGPASRAMAAWMFGIGAVILVLCRPFEGLLLLFPVLVAVALRNREPRVWLPILLCGAVGAGWLGLYHYRVTGSPLHLPYSEYQRQYETVPQFNFLPVSPQPAGYRHLHHEWVDRGWLLDQYRIARSPRFLLIRFRDWLSTLRVYLAGIILVVPLLGLMGWLARCRKWRFLCVLFALIFAGTLLEVPQFPHYPAPFMAVILILTVQSLRLAWRRHGKPLVVVALVALFVQVAGNDARRIYRGRTPDRFRSTVAKKRPMERHLAQTGPGRHVIFVRYTRFRAPHEEWIYNAAEIDRQPVIWAQDMGPEENRKLVARYPGRAFWRFEPDESSDMLMPLQR